MRPDMFKVIVERPRVGGKYHKGNRNRGRVRSPDDLPSKEGMSRPYGYDGKSLNENLSPLKRFIQSRVGRKWDDVYSEICENLKVTSTVQDHVRSHIDDMIDRKCYVNDRGHIWSSGRYGGPSRVTYGLYVDPTDGIIKDAGNDRKRWWRDPRPEDKPKEVTFREVGHEQELWKVDGVWYWAVFSDHPGPRVTYRSDDKGNTIRVETPVTVHDYFGKIEELHHAYAPYRSWSTFRPKEIHEGRYRSGKRQAGGKDLRKHGLSNDRR